MTSCPESVVYAVSALGVYGVITWFVICRVFEISRLLVFFNGIFH